MLTFGPAGAALLLVALLLAHPAGAAIVERPGAAVESGEMGLGRHLGPPRDVIIEDRHYDRSPL